MESETAKSETRNPPFDSANGPEPACPEPVEVVEGKSATNTSLADYAGQYRGKNKMERPPADPLGIDGLPGDRVHLDALVGELIGRLKTAGQNGLAGKTLAGWMNLTGTRALRRLVAYARLHQHEHRILGLPGTGYFWSDAVPDSLRKTVGRQCQRMGRCYFYIASLLRRQGSAMAAVQMIFNFMEHEVPAGERFNDDLAALVAAEGVKIQDVINALVAEMARTEKGRDILRGAIRKHSEVLLPKEVLAEIVRELDVTRNRLAEALSGN